MQAPGWLWREEVQIPKTQGRIYLVTSQLESQAHSDGSALEKIYRTALLSGEEEASKEGNRGTGFPQEGVTDRPLGGPLPSELRDEVLRVQKQLAALERLERKWCPGGMVCRETEAVASIL